jgi:hypothetical protein
MVTDEDAGKRLRVRAQTFVQTQFSFEAVGQKYSRRLFDIQESRARNASQNDGLGLRAGLS